MIRCSYPLPPFESGIVSRLTVWPISLALGDPYLPSVTKRPSSILMKCPMISARVGSLASERIEPLAGLTRGVAPNAFGARTPSCNTQASIILAAQSSYCQWAIPPLPQSAPQELSTQKPLSLYPTIANACPPSEFPPGLICPLTGSGVIQLEWI